MYLQTIFIMIVHCCILAYIIKHEQRDDSEMLVLKKIRKRTALK